MEDKKATQSIPVSLDPKTLRQADYDHDWILHSLMSAQQKLAPLWDVRDYVAVNPFFGFRESPFLDVMQKIKNLTGSSLLPRKSFFLDKYSRGEIKDENLVESLMLLQIELGAQFTDDYDLKKVVEFIKTPEIVQEASSPILCLSDISDRDNQQTLTSLITLEVSKWAAAFFDEGQAHWSMPDKERGLYAAWRSLITYDTHIEKFLPLHKVVKELPYDPEQAIIKMTTDLLKHADPGEGDLENYYLRLIFTVKGWASYIKKFDFEKSLGLQKNHQPLVSLLDIVAIRMAYDMATLPLIKHQPLQLFYQPSAKSTMPTDVYKYIWLQAFELSERQKITQKIQNNSLKTDFGDRPLAQMVFCIDVRSEVIRRHIEKQSSLVQTLGFAGFFGLPISYKQIGFEGDDAQCPVLLKPLVQIKEASQDELELTHQRQKAVHNIYGSKDIQSSANSSFAVAETFGFSYAFKMILSSLSQLKTNTRIESLGLKESQKKDVFFDLQSVDLKTRVTMAYSALKNMGLKNQFSKYIFLFGHGGECTNNPFEGALDCGACAGHNGKFNAKLLAQLLNDFTIRQELTQMGVIIPKDTTFVAGWHNTTRDELMIDNMESNIPSLAHYKLFETIFKNASEECRAERFSKIPHATVLTAADVQQEAANRAEDWSEVRPEWALAKNNCFIVGRRELTYKLDLEGRSFLHDYDPFDDADLSKLELIMTAPMVVTNWINMQYYASTIDPYSFGVGDKTINNVVGTIGCVQGNEGDLAGGLSLQSVWSQGQYYHEPMRLQVYIEAFTSSIEQIIKKHKIVSDLINNGWLHIVAIDPETRKACYWHKHQWVTKSEDLWN